MTHQFDQQAFVRRMEAAGMMRQVAEKLADLLGSSVLDAFATGRDLRELALQQDGHLRETELRLRQDLKELELRMTVRFGAMLGGATALTVAILGALIALK